MVITENIDKNTENYDFQDYTMNLLIHALLVSPLQRGSHSQTWTVGAVEGEGHGSVG